MPRIKVLPENVANMIAAGEVINRPASVVKELVENSLDAESDKIEIHVRQYGKGEIKVVDNGHGMGYHDAMLAFERHATSKISCPSDLQSIHTLGFRGEALPSIASVALFKLMTREKGAEMGTQIIIDGGKLLKVSEVGAPRGTTIQVSSLFKNIPARRKFLKSNAVELNHITQTLHQIAVSRYQNHFAFYHNQRVIWHLQRAGSLGERIQQLYDDEITDHLLEVDQECEFFKIHGFIGNITYTKTNRFSQYLYVNNRCIRNPLLLKAISEGYSHVIPQGRHPICFLFFTIPADQIDVNVHPAKVEVRFSNQQRIFEQIVCLIKDRLASSRTVPKGSKALSIPLINTDIKSPPVGETPAMTFKGPIEEVVREKQTIPEDYLNHIYHPSPEKKSTGGDKVDNYQEKVQAAFFSSKPSFQKIVQNEDPNQFFIPESDFFQLDNSFIFFESSKSLVIVDQHAAHERIRYEQLQKEYRAKTTLCSQGLVAPIPFQVPRHLIELAEELLAPLKAVGFEIEYFGQDTFVIKAIPLLLSKTNPLDLIQNIFDNLSEFSQNDTSALINALLIRMACSSAIKANRKMNTEEMRSLIEQLRETAMPFRCPHGRPTTIQLHLKVLKKHFLRT